KCTQAGVELTHGYPLHGSAQAKDLRNESVKFRSRFRNRGGIGPNVPKDCLGDNLQIAASCRGRLACLDSAARNLIPRIRWSTVLSWGPTAAEVPEIGNAPAGAWTTLGMRGRKRILNEVCRHSDAPHFSHCIRLCKDAQVLRA